MVAHPCLDAADRVPEGIEVGLHHAGQGAHQHQAAELRRIGLGKLQECGELLDLRLSVRSLAATVEHEKQAPFGRERLPGDDRRRNAVARRSSVDHEPAVVEQPDSETGTGPPIQGGRDVGRAHVEIEQLRHARADRKGELRPGAQPRVRRDGLLHVDPHPFAEVETLRQRRRIARRARSVRPFGGDPRTTAQAHAGERSLQGEPEAPVPAARAAVEIDETHVQPGGRPDGDTAVGADRHAAAGTGYSNRLCR